MEYVDSMATFGKPDTGRKQTNTTQTQHNIKC